MWDCATGSGQAALGLAARFDAVLATDISPAQLAQAPPHDRVRYAAAAAEAAPLAGRSVDLVTAAQAVHWFDFARFFAEVGRVCRPGGVLAIWCYHDFRVAPRVDEVLSCLHGEILGRHWLPRRRYVETGYADVPVPFEPITVTTEKLERRWVLKELLGYLGTWSAGRIYEREHGIDPVSLVEPDLREAWGDHRRSAPVAWTLTLRAFSAG